MQITLIPSILGSGYIKYVDVIDDLCSEGCFTSLGRGWPTWVDNGSENPEEDSSNFIDRATSGLSLEDIQALVDDGYISDLNILRLAYTLGYMKLKLVLWLPDSEVGQESMIKIEYSRGEADSIDRCVVEYP